MGTKVLKKVLLVTIIALPFISLQARAEDTPKPTTKKVAWQVSKAGVNQTGESTKTAKQVSTRPGDNSLWAVMIEYQKELQKEQREDRSLSRNAAKQKVHEKVNQAENKVRELDQQRNDAQDKFATSLAAGASQGGQDAQNSAARAEEEARKAAEEARKKAEEEKKKAEDEARRRQEQANNTANQAADTVRSWVP